MTDALPPLRSVVDHLIELVRPLDDAAVAGPAYPTEWAVADVLSHLGSGSVIWQRRIDDALAGTETPDELNPSVWDEWNAKSPRTKTDDALAAMDAAVTQLEQLPADDRARLDLPMGPLRVDFERFVRLRLAELLLHSWDVAVALDPAAALDPEGTDIVVDGLDMMARWTGRPEGDPRTIVVATTDPVRSFTIDVQPDAVTMTGSTAAADEPDLTMPAESFVRLVYGRLDPDHTPGAVTGDAAALDQLRAVFPGP